MRPDQTAPFDGPKRARGSGHPRLGFVLVLLAALALGGWGAWRTFAPQPANAGEQLAHQTQRIDQLEQQVATLTRSDQISRQANSELQGTLAERDEEIASLRADIAFYERFVGATGQRRGLSVHELKLVPQRDPQLWHVVATLTQNMNRGAVSRGRLQLVVEASEQGRMHKLDWAELRQQKSAPGIEYSFKYFEQAEGDIMLPVGIKPVRVIARLLPETGAAVEQSFTWDEAVSTAPGVDPEAH
ncbi:MAG: DUF6776 family protein [Thermomonas sp.]